MLYARDVVGTHTLTHRINTAATEDKLAFGSDERAATKHEIEDRGRPAVFCVVNPLPFYGELPIQRQIQFQHVHPGFSQQSPIRAFHEAGDQPIGLV